MYASLLNYLSIGKERATLTFSECNAMISFLSISRRLCFNYIDIDLSENISFCMRFLSTLFSRSWVRVYL